MYDVFRISTCVSLTIENSPTRVTHSRSAKIGGKNSPYAMTYALRLRKLINGSSKNASFKCIGEGPLVPSNPCSLSKSTHSRPILYTTHLHFTHNRKVNKLTESNYSLWSARLARKSPSCAVTYVTSTPKIDLRIVERHGLQMHRDDSLVASLDPRISHAKSRDIRAGDR